MKIYYIKRTSPVEYDEYDGHIIAVKNVRQIPLMLTDYWLLNDSETIEIGNYTGPETQPFIILSSFNAG